MPCHYLNCNLSSILPLDSHKILRTGNLCNLSRNSPLFLHQNSWSVSFWQLYPKAVKIMLFFVANYALVLAMNRSLHHHCQCLLKIWKSTIESLTKALQMAGRVELDSFECCGQGYYWFLVRHLSLLISRNILKLSRINRKISFVSYSSALNHQCFLLGDKACSWRRPLTFLATLCWSFPCCFPAYFNY